MNSKLIFALFIVATTAQAKIGDPAGITKDGKAFTSHANSVKATQAEKTLWETTLPYSVEPLNYLPGLEHDVQWCTTQIQKVTRTKVEAENCIHDQFTLDRNTGKLLKTKYTKTRLRSLNGDHTIQYPAPSPSSH